MSCYCMSSSMQNWITHKKILSVVDFIKICNKSRFISKVKSCGLTEGIVQPHSFMEKQISIKPIVSEEICLS